MSGLIESVLEVTVVRLPFRAAVLISFDTMNHRSIFRAIAVLAVAGQVLAGCAYLKAPSRATTAEVSQRNHAQYVEGQENESAYEFLSWLLQWLSLL